MKKQIWMAAVAASVLLLGGCGGGSTDDASTKQGSAEAYTDYSIAKAPEEDPRTDEGKLKANAMQDLPRLALQCGGSGYRNGLIVFSPDDGVIYSASIVDEQKMTSTKIWRKESKVRAIMGVKYEIIIDLQDLSKYQENSNYSPNSEMEENSCRESIKAAEYDCATAANFRKCMYIRHPQEASRSDGGYCSIMGAHWMWFECDVIGDSEYDDALGRVKSYTDYEL